MSNGEECAFPNQGLDIHGQPAHEPSYGLTKREYFAAMAMQGLTGVTVENIEQALKVAGQSSIGTPEKLIATFAVECADALLKALEEEKAS